MPDLIDPNKQDTLLSRLVKSFDWKGLDLFGIGRLVAKTFSTAKRPKGQRVEITEDAIIFYDAFGNIIFNINPIDGFTVTFNGGSLLFNQNGIFSLSTSSIDLGDTRHIGHNGSYIRFFDNGAGTTFLGFYIGSTIRATINENQFLVKNSDDVEVPVGEFGTYTPIVSNSSNLDGSTTYLCNWSRSGNMLTASGQINLDPTAAGGVTLNLSLPIASTFVDTSNCSGVIVCHSVQQSGIIYADAANGKALINYICVDGVNRVFFFILQYQVL